ncbi:unnamed protein product [Rotaria sordida]|uniref:Uncharacterized protein n=1 Tax=Rotaria sordida TaxID=392033 RepID=A0A815SWR9_9BILA|nr:unnamed protein product [Rotaria sordida]
MPKKKVTRVLSKDSNEKKIVIRSLTQTVGLLPLDTHQRVTRKVPIQILNDNTSFYCRDDISYQMSGKRDTVVIKENGNKITYQKRILLYNIRGAFELFVAENSGVSVSRTFFAEMRPPYVLVESSMSHRVCVCVHHENVNLLLNSLSKHIHGSSCSDLYSFTSALVCNDSDYECMSSSCSYCKNYFDLHIKNNVGDPNAQIKWHQWKNINGYAMKEEQQGIVQECIGLLSSKIKSFLLHVYIKR